MVGILHAVLWCLVENMTRMKCPYAKAIWHQQAQTDTADVKIHTVTYHRSALLRRNDPAVNCQKRTKAVSRAYRRNRDHYHYLAPNRDCLVYRKSIYWKWNLKFNSSLCNHPSVGQRWTLRLWRLICDNVPHSHKQRGAVTNGRGATVEIPHFKLQKVRPCKHILLYLNRNIIKIF
jgi:hypothetical protein